KQENNLNLFIEENLEQLSYVALSKIIEASNTLKTDNAAYYTRQDIIYSIVKDLPEAENYSTLRILEPSVGVGNFLPLLIKKYIKVKELIIDVVDIDESTLVILKKLIRKLKLPNNVKINFIHNDFLLNEFDSAYDIVIGNPPFKKCIGDKEILKTYKNNLYNDQTNNLFSFFI